MNNGEYFKIKTVEELKEAYEMFKNEWWDRFKLSNEIYYFKRYSEYRTIVKDLDGDVSLKKEPISSSYKEIPSPLKKQKNMDLIRAGEFNFSKDLPDEFTLLVKGEGFESKNIRAFIEDTHRLISTSVSGNSTYYFYKGESVVKKSSLQKTLEIGDLNISILKALTANGIVDERLTGTKAQKIVDKIDELSRIILK